MFSVSVVADIEFQPILNRLADIEYPMDIQNWLADIEYPHKHSKSTSRYWVIFKNTLKRRQKGQFFILGGFRLWRTRIRRNCSILTSGSLYTVLTLIQGNF